MVKAQGCLGSNSLLRPYQDAKRNGRVHTESRSGLYGERIAGTYEEGYTSVNFLHLLPM